MSSPDDTYRPLGPLGIVLRTYELRGSESSGGKNLLLPDLSSRIKSAQLYAELSRLKVLDGDADGAKLYARKSVTSARRG